MNRAIYEAVLEAHRSIRQPRAAGGALPENLLSVIGAPRPVPSPMGTVFSGNSGGHTVPPLAPIRATPLAPSAALRAGSGNRTTAPDQAAAAPHQGRVVAPARAISAPGPAGPSAAGLAALAALQAMARSYGSPSGGTPPAALAAPVGAAPSAAPRPTAAGLAALRALQAMAANPTASTAPANAGPAHPGLWRDLGAGAVKGVEGIAAPIADVANSVLNPDTENVLAPYRTRFGHAPVVNAPRTGLTVNKIAAGVLPASVVKPVARLTGWANRTHPKTLVGEAVQGIGEMGPFAVGALIPGADEATLASRAADLGGLGVMGAGAGVGQDVGQSVGSEWGHPVIGGVVGSLVGGIGAAGVAGAARGGARVVASLVRGAKIPLTEGSPAAIADAFRARLNDIDAAHSAAITAARTRASELLAQIIGASPEEAGQTARAEIAARHAPALAAAHQAEAAAQAELDQHVAGIGGETPAGRGEIGARLRGFVRGADAERERQANELWNLAQRNGDLRFNAAPVKRAAADAAASLNLMGGDRLTAREAELHDLIQKWPRTVDFDTLKTLRSNISGSMNDLRSDGRAMGRLGSLRDGVDDAIENAVENRAVDEEREVNNGRINPAQTLFSDLSVPEGVSGSAPPADTASDLGGGTSGQSGPVHPQLRQQPGGGDVLRPARDAGRDAEGQGSISPGYRGGENLAGTSRLSVGRPQSLLSFLVAKGGVRPNGDLEAMDARIGRPGLVNRRGLTLDRAREAAEEVGYLPPGSTIADLLDQVDAELRGNRVYRPEDAADAQMSRAGEGDLEPYYRERASQDVAASARGYGFVLTPAEHQHAVDLILNSDVHPDEAVRQAVAATEAQMLGELPPPWATEAPDFAALDGAEPDAGAPDSTTTGSTAERYASARADWRDYKGIFGDRTAAAEVLKRGPFGGGHAVADEDVARRFFHSGPNAGRDAGNFIAATGGDAEARDLLAEHAARDLRAKATNPNGSINSVKWRKWITDHAEPLDALGLRDRFGTVADAADRLTELRAQRESLDQQLRAASGTSDATVMRHYWKAGPAAADAIRDYITQTGGTPEAMQAIQDHIADDLMARHGRTGRLSPGGYQGWAAQHRAALAVVPDIAGRFADAAAAQRVMNNATAAHLAQRETFERSAARFFLQGDPQTAIGRAMGRTATNDPVTSMRDLAALVKGDAYAEAGLRRGVADWIGQKMHGGNPGARLGDVLKRDRTALAQVLTPQQMAVLNRMAATSRQSVFGRLAEALAGHGARHLTPQIMAGALGWEVHGAMGTIAAEAGLGLLRSLIVNRMDSLGAMVDRIIADPATADLMARQAATPAAGQRIASRLFLSTTAAGADRRRDPGLPQSGYFGNQEVRP